MLKLEDFKSEKISGDKLLNLRGGGEGYSSGNVVITYGGQTYTGDRDKFTREDGEITCLEIYSDGEWITIV